MKKKIWFDMDGTIADLYGVENWLERLRAYDVTPYEIAEPLVPMKSLAKLLNAVKRRGYAVGIISWTSADDNDEYNRFVEHAKYYWLRTHLKNVNFDKILFVPYGTDKAEATGGGILFDDNADVRKAWINDYDDEAHTPDEILEVLRGLL